MTLLKMELKVQTKLNLKSVRRLKTDRWSVQLFGLVGLSRHKTLTVTA